MRILRSAESINAEIESCSDPRVASLLSTHVDFVLQHEDYAVEDLFHAFIVEPGDTLHTIDEAMDGQFLTNYYSGKQYGQPGFKPCCETLEEYPSFFEMFFVLSDEGLGLAVIVPKLSTTNQKLLSLCSQFSTPASRLP